MLPLVFTAACATSVRVRRIWRLPLGDLLLRDTSADSSRTGQAPIQEAQCLCEGKAAASGPTSAITCCAESAPYPGTSASRTTAPLLFFSASAMLWSRFPICWSINSTLSRINFKIWLVRRQIAGELDFEFRAGTGAAPVVYPHAHPISAPRYQLMGERVHTPQIRQDDGLTLSTAPSTFRAPSRHHCRRPATEVFMIFRGPQAHADRMKSCAAIGTWPPETDANRLAGCLRPTCPTWHQVFPG